MLYVLQRYCLLLCAILRLYAPRSLSSCHVYLGVVYTTEALGFLGVALFSSLRTWAVCGRINFSVVAVFLCSMFVPCVNVYNYSRPVTYVLEDGYCTITVQVLTLDDYFPIITRCMAVFADALVIVITWAKSMDTLKASVQLQGFKPQSSIVLFRNGVMYFV